MLGLLPAPFWSAQMHHGKERCPGCNHAASPLPPLRLPALSMLTQARVLKTDQGGHSFMLGRHGSAALTYALRS